MCSTATVLGAAFGGVVAVSPLFPISSSYLGHETDHLVLESCLPSSFYHFVLSVDSRYPLLFIVVYLFATDACLGRFATSRSSFACSLHLALIVERWWQPLTQFYDGPLRTRECS